MANLEKVSDELVAKAYVNFVSLYYPTKQGVGAYFWNFLGIKSMPSLRASWNFEPKIISKLEMLAGPHYKTVAKAMEANGANWKEPVDL